ncbi:MAG: oligosaccharide flippase family protein [Acidobacteriaceae bacterium]
MNKLVPLSVSRIAARFSDVRRSALARNTGWVLLGQGFFLVFQTAYFIIAARLLGSREYGIFAGSVALVTAFTTFSSLGAGMVLIRYVSPDRSQFQQYWGNVFVSALLTGGIMVPLATVFGVTLIHAATVRLMITIALADCVFAKVTEGASLAFQAFEQLRFTAGLNVLASAVRLGVALTLWLWLKHVSVEEWALALLCASAVVGTVSTLMVCSRLGLPRLRPRLFFRRVAEGFGFSLAFSTTSIYNDVDKAMLTHYGMYAANGGYAVAYKIIDIGCLPLKALHAAAFPRFFQIGTKGVRSSGAYSRVILRRTLPAALCAGLAIFLLAPLAPAIVGSSFFNVTDALRWLCILPAFRALHLSAGDALTGAGYQRFRTASQVTAAALNFAANLYLIPHFSWHGAAWSSLLTDGTLAAMNWTVVTILRSRSVTQPNTLNEPDTLIV